MRLVFWLVGVPLAVAVALFAVTNRDDVTIEFLGYAAVLPKFMLILGAIFVGLLIGGTSAWSGGWMWIPRNPLAREAGIHEDPEAARQYLQHELGERFDPKRTQAYLDHGPSMVDFFRRHTALQFIDGNAIPDFHGHTPDAALGGRSVCAAPFDGRRLGATLAVLKPPLYETTFLGLGIASGAELRHYMQAMLFRVVRTAISALTKPSRPCRGLIAHSNVVTYLVRNQ